MVGWIVALLLASSSVLAGMEDKSIHIELIDKQLNLPAIIQLRDQMPMSQKPKELSKQPSATCFQANIDDYLLDKSETKKKIYGCIFSDQAAMNSSLLRAGMFVHTGAGNTTDNQLFSSKLMTAVGGHDFDGTELVKYNQEVNIPTESAPEHIKFKLIERQFKQEVIDKIISENNKNFIFFSVINTKKFKANITHELLHAQYYNVPQIAPILLEVWSSKVSIEDKQIIIACLKNGGYDMEQQDLLLREFYSYFLQYDSTEYIKSIKVLANMASLSAKYAPQIAKALEQHNIKIISLDKKV